MRTAMVHAAASRNARCCTAYQSPSQHVMLCVCDWCGACLRMLMHVGCNMHGMVWMRSQQLYCFCGRPYHTSCCGALTALPARIASQGLPSTCRMCTHAAKPSAVCPQPPTLTHAHTHTNMHKRTHAHEYARTHTHLLPQTGNNSRHAGAHVHICTCMCTVCACIHALPRNVGYNSAVIVRGPRYGPEAASLPPNSRTNTRMHRGAAPLHG